MVHSYQDACWHVGCREELFEILVPAAVLSTWSSGLDEGHSYDKGPGYVPSSANRESCIDLRLAVQYYGVAVQ
jgi:hypothetical protein